MARTPIAVIVSSKTTNEDGYLMQKFAHHRRGTNNVDNCSRYRPSPATMGLFRTVGYGGDSRKSIEDIGRSEYGSDHRQQYLAENHPVLATRIKLAHKLHGRRLIVADPHANMRWRNAPTFISGGGPAQTLRKSQPSLEHVRHATPSWNSSLNG